MDNLITFPKRKMSLSVNEILASPRLINQQFAISQEQKAIRLLLTLAII